MSEKRLKRERIGFYVDCILGSISASISLSAVIFIVVTEGVEAIQANTNFIISLTFWVFYLIFSFSIVGYGSYKIHQEKNYEKWKAKMKKRKKKLDHQYFNISTYLVLFSLTIFHRKYQYRVKN